MKKLFKTLLLGAFVPVFALTFSGSKTTRIADDNQRVAKPYIVAIIDAAGNSAGEFRGTSLSLDPFGIAVELGAKPFIEDKFTAFPDLKMDIGSKITLYRAPSFEIFDGKKQLLVRSWTENVGALLLETKLPELGDDDKINFSLDTKTENNMQIRIIRVAITTVHETQSITFKTIKKDDKTLDQGKTRIDRKGVAGEKVLSYIVRREDGVQVSKTLSKIETTKDPIDELLIIGTKPVIIGWCKYNDLVLDASIKNGLDPNRLCKLMKIESNGNTGSVSGGGHQGLFQYTPSFWADASRKAGFAGASWQDPKAQIYTTAWALTHGYESRW